MKDVGTNDKIWYSMNMAIIIIIMAKWRQTGMDN